jgi:2-hydroxymuconate-semialdehyde hydrolase
MINNPEIGKRVLTGAFESNVHDVGSGDPVLLIHGSGPGVSGWANWRLVLPTLARKNRVVVPDMVGFGYTDRPANMHYDMHTWVQQALDLMDSLEIERADVVGNSFGGALALALAIRAPHRVRRLVLMGSVGVPFQITPGLDAVWGYEPSFDNMRSIMDLFAYSRDRVTDELAQLRYEASARPGVQESYASMFPAPRQQWVDSMASAEADIRALPHETLIIHGREDKIIPLETSLTLSQWIPNMQLHVYGHCGHWTQIEHSDRFSRLVSDFFAEAGSAAQG